MTGTALLFLVLGLGLVGWIVGRARAAAFVRAAKGGPRGQVNSLPSYHGWFVAVCAVVPAVIFMFIWQSVSPALVTNMVLSAPAASGLPQDGFCTRGHIVRSAINCDGVTGNGVSNTKRETGPAL